MLKNYFKVALRNLIRNGAFSAINIMGLAVGITASIFILLWVQDEKSYDRFHNNAKELYRVVANLSGTDAALIPPVMIPELQAKMPVIKNMVRLSYPEPSVFEVGIKKNQEKRVFYADSTFLQLFSFPLVKGNAAIALRRPDAVLLTRDMANKYFGTEDVLGKIMRLNNGRNVIVTGVFATIPENSHLQFDFIMPMSAIDTHVNNGGDDWQNFSFFGYLQLNKNFKATPDALNNLDKQLDQVFRGHVPEKELKANFHLQPLTDIHLHSNYEADLPGHGNIQYVNIFSIVAIFVLAVACINFMNLTTARSVRRSKEVGLRKTLGANRRSLILQFLGESLFVSFLALIIAIGLVGLLLPVFNNITGKQISIHLFDTEMVALLIGIALVTGLFSGAYPALFLSGFSPVKVFKGNRKAGTGNLLFRNGLVVLQFVVSIMLIGGTTVVYKQLKFIKEMNLGFEKSNLVYMPVTGDLFNKKDALKAILQQNVTTTDFTLVDDLPVNMANASTDVTWEGKTSDKKQTMFAGFSVDNAFFDVFQMKIIKGRAFLKNSKADTSNYIINEKAAKVMGLTSDKVIGTALTQWGNKGIIVGVVKDFNFKPVHQPIEPLILRYNSGDGYAVVRTTPGNTAAAIKTLEEANAALNPGYPFSFGFIDQDLDHLYKGEQQMEMLLNVFTILALFISCLGLYGLSAFLAEQRTKEIGIRKVMGASVVNVVYLLSSSFTKLVLIAVIISVPVSWFVMNSWLQGFAYRINVNVVVFFTASLIALLVAWITIGYESIKAAVANPVRSLRSE